MKPFASDFHIHSRFSRATSKKLTVELLHHWASLKGLTVIGTGDFTHPEWFDELRNMLEPAEQGLFKVRSGLESGDSTPRSCRRDVRFVLATEISNIYKRGGKVRKVHNVVMVPGFDAAAKLIGRLGRIGNLASDGRPILGLDSEILLEIVLECGDGACLIPAHIWTPWFSALGSKSGFDSIEECYGDLAGEIFSVETGLSSDPEMNRRVESLDKFTLISCSDAHSAVKLAREATLFETELSYDAMIDALRSGEAAGYRGTVEFYAEEGKYHYDGHRKCGVRFTPRETTAADGRCPACGKPVTVGVSNRVMELADRENGSSSPAASEYHSTIPLHEIISEIVGVGPASKRVAGEYFKLLDIFGPELDILITTPVNEISDAGFSKLATALERMRRGAVYVEAGYDGKFGKITLFRKDNAGNETNQGSLFEKEVSRIPDDSCHGGREGPGGGAGAGGDDGGSLPDGDHRSGAGAGGDDGGSLPDGDHRSEAGADPAASRIRETSLDKYEPASIPRSVDTVDPAHHSTGDPWNNTPSAGETLAGLDSDQERAARRTEGVLIIEAGPGAGKTRTIVSRIRHMVEDPGVPPENILAVTFTNRAAGELRERLGPALCGEAKNSVTVKTFHSLCLGILRDEIGDIRVLDRNEAEALMDEIRRSDPEWKQIRARDIRDAVSLLFRKSPVENNKSIGAKASSGAGAVEGEVDIEEDEAGVGEGEGGGDAGEGRRRIEEDGTIPRLEELFIEYVKKLDERNATDFDYIVFRVNRLLAGSPELLRRLKEKYTHISVDEFQDVDGAQYRFLTQLAGPGRPNLCVIGDPGQSIYGFRGADPRFMTQIAIDYPETVTVTLSRNYRSTGTLVEASRQVASSVCDPAISSPGILPAPGTETGPEIRIARFNTAGAEAEFVSSAIERLTGGISHFSVDSGRLDGNSGRDDENIEHIGFSDIAVLYRTSLVAGPVAASLKKLGIPFQSTGETLVTETPQGRKILAALASVAAGKRSGIVAFPALEKGIAPGKTLVRDLVLAAARSQDGSESGKSPGTTDAGIERAGILAELAAPFGTDLDSFLAFSQTLRPEDMFDPRAEQVSLMTVHSSKGLEFPVVFIIGCEEGVIPFVKDSGTPRSEIGGEDGPAGEPDSVWEDEERRLFFVGMTRAEKMLFLTSAGKRLIFGKTRKKPRSRYVDAIDAALTKRTGLKEKKQQAGLVQGTLF